VFILTSRLDRGGRSYRKILQILKLLNQFLLKQGEILTQMILSKFHFCPYHHQLLKQYPLLITKVRNWVQSILSAKTSNFTSLDDDLKRTLFDIKNFYLEWSLLYDEKKVNDFKVKIENVGV